MSEGTEVDRPVVQPALNYEDPKAALTWLCRAFGFVERWRMEGPDGTLYIGAIELASGGGGVMIAGLTEALKGQMRSAFPDRFRDSQSPWPNLFYSITVLVPDVDAHFAVAQREGATIVSEVTDQPWGYRDYEALDLEGRQWNFSQPVRETQPEDWGATSSGA
jgi:uncharacterized glyoxalase superfamily protein PhnB